MGAWGHRAFENDAALDWFADLEFRGLPLINSTLKRAARCRGELDADDAQSALAASEVLARLCGRRSQHDDDTAEVERWVKLNNIKPQTKQIELAIRAIDQVLYQPPAIDPGATWFQRLLFRLRSLRSIRYSELRDLWEDSDHFEDWQKDVLDLRARLTSCL